MADSKAMELGDLRQRPLPALPQDEEDEDEGELRISQDPAEPGYKNGYKPARPLSESSDGADADVPSLLYTKEEERRVLRKLDLRVVCFMSFLYLLSFLDRSNIGNAKIAGLMEDLNISDGQFEWLLTAFYINYIAFEWMILLYHYLRPHVYISICVLSWGLVASLQSLATSFWFMIILRALLGLGEAAFSPGVPYYLSFFYRREELALRAGIQVSAAPLAASFAGSLAWLITYLGQDGPLASWRLLFLVEGFPGIIAAIIAFRIVPDNVDTAWFLTERERMIARARLRADDVSADAVTPRDPLFSPGQAKKTKRSEWAEILDTIRDPKSYLTAFMFFSCNVAFSSMPVFLPSVINEMGYTSITSQALSFPPFLASFFIVLLTAQLSDSMKNRSSFVLFHALMSFAAYGLIAICGIFGWPNLLRYLLVYPACAGFFSAITIIITWTMNNQESEAKKGAGMAVLNIIGQCGPLIGTRLYPDSDAPEYIMGMSSCALAMGIVAVLVLVLRRVLRKENERREAMARSSPAAGYVLHDLNENGTARPIDADAEESQPLATSIGGIESGEAVPKKIADPRVAYFKLML